ncbi:MAG: LPD23 domain-containing protein, partial [Pseudomonadota bacterium]
MRQGLLPEAAAQAAKVDVEMMRREWETGRRGFALANGLAQRGDAAQRYTDAEIDQIARETEVLVTSFLEAVFMRYGITVERLQERFPEFLRVERIQELGVEGAAEAIVEQAGDPPPRAPSGDLKGIFQRDTGRIGLTEAADASTAVHEVFHGFIDALIRMAERDDAPDLLKRDLADGVLEAARQVGADGITWRDLGSVGTVAQMIGPRAQGADRSTYGRAETMIAEGVDRETVRRETGWYELGGELWAETSDADARLSAAGLDAIDRAAQAFISQRRGDTADPPPATMPLGDFYNHPTLFENYPQLRRVKVELEIPSEDGAPTQRAGSYYDQQRRTIFVNALERSEYDSVIGVRDPEQIRFELIHEIQHAIQHIEGRTPGSSPRITGIARVRELTPSDTLRADPDFIRAKAAFNAFKGMPKTDFEDHALPRAELEARIAAAYRRRGVPSDEIDQDAESLGISTAEWLNKFFALPGVPEAVERIRRLREETAATELDSDTVDAETGQRREFGRALPFRSDPEGVAANRRQRTAYQRGLGEVVARLAMVRKSLSESDLAARSPDEDLDLRREDILTDQRFSDVVGDDDVSSAELEARSVAERMVAALDLVRATLEVYPTPDHVKVLAEHPSRPGEYWDPHESPDVVAIQDAYGAVHQLMQPNGYYEGVGALPRAMTQFAREVSDPRRHNQFPQAQRYADALVRLDDLRIGALRAREAVERDRGKEIGEIPHDVPDYRERSIPIQVRSARRKARALYKVLAEIYAARREIMLAKQDIDATPRGSLYEPDADDRLASVFSPGATSGRDVLNPFGSGPETEPAPDAVMRDLMDAADAEPEAEAAPVAKKRRRLFGLFQRVGPRAAGADGEALARAKQMWESGATTG